MLPVYRHPKHGIRPKNKQCVRHAHTMFIGSFTYIRKSSNSIVRYWGWHRQPKRIGGAPPTKATTHSSPNLNPIPKKKKKKKTASQPEHRILHTWIHSICVACAYLILIRLSIRVLNILWQSHIAHCLLSAVCLHCLLVSTVLFMFGLRAKDICRNFLAIYIPSIHGAHRKPPTIFGFYLSGGVSVFKQAHAVVHALREYNNRHDNKNVMTIVSPRNRFQLSISPQCVSSPLFSQSMRPISPVASYRCVVSVLSANSMCHNIGFWLVVGAVLYAGSGCRALANCAHAAVVSFWHTTNIFRLLI